MNNPTNHLMVSGSFDWNVKLWYPKMTENCVMTFKHHQDYVTDTKFNPIHPAKFLSSDASGKFAVWNLLKSVDQPSYTHEMPGVSITKVRWNIDGQHFAVCDSEARITVFKQNKKALEYNDEDLKEFVGVIGQHSSFEDTAGQTLLGRTIN